LTIFDANDYLDNMVNTSLDDRIRRIEDLSAIKDLAVLYGFVMDERDLGSVRRLFAADATLRSADGVFAATGIEEIVKTYEGRFAALGPTNHFTHGHVVRIDDADPDRATGVLSSHAEVVRDGTAMIVGLRYKDAYRRASVGWQFQDRLMSYMYYIDVREYAESLPGPLRVRAYGDQRPADWPEALTDKPDLGWLTDLLA
jgi:hypothetical protein